MDILKDLILSPKVTLPVSLLFVVKVVQVFFPNFHQLIDDRQEYERAVIFRLGLLLSGGARGPGVLAILTILMAPAIFIAMIIILTFLLLFIIILLIAILLFTIAIVIIVIAVIIFKVFFVIPCVDVYEKIDMRTQTFNVPPQEVRMIRMLKSTHNITKTLKFKDSFQILPIPNKS